MNGMHEIQSHSLSLCFFFSLSLFLSLFFFLSLSLSSYDITHIPHLSFYPSTRSLLLHGRPHMTAFSSVSRAIVTDFLIHLFCWYVFVFIAIRRKYPLWYTIICTKLSCNNYNRGLLSCITFDVIAILTQLTNKSPSDHGNAKQTKPWIIPFLFVGKKMFIIPGILMVFNVFVVTSQTYLFYLIKHS